MKARQTSGATSFSFLQAVTLGPPLGDWPTWLGVTLLIIGSAMVCYGDEPKSVDRFPQEVTEIAPISLKDAQEAEFQASTNDSPGELNKKRFREGMTIRDRQARFVVTGERSELIPSDGTASILVLENLNLQRIRAEMVKLGAGIRWDVTAEVTEFEGNNFVLIKRAVIASDLTDLN